MNKGLDAMFMNFGIRNEDMEIIKNICEEAQIDFDWFKDFILKEYHELKMKNEDLLFVGRSLFCKYRACILVVQTRFIASLF